MAFLNRVGRAEKEAPRKIPTETVVEWSAGTRGSGYRRYHIETRKTPHLAGVPPRFRVLVRRSRLALLLLKEFFQYRGNPRIVFSRPCVYGVFSGPVGGFMPREHLCVGCLRCTVQYPDVVQIVRHPNRQKLGDSYFTAHYVDAILYEAETGLVPVRGAGYRGVFGGNGWDSLWTDMSEIVRPTRDGIHGREFISTSVDIGALPPRLRFDGHTLVGPAPRVFSLQVPFMLDALPDSLADSEVLLEAYARVAQETESLAFAPVVRAKKVAGPAVAPIVVPGEETLLETLREPPVVIEISPVPPSRLVTAGEGLTDAMLRRALDALMATQARFPSAILILRIPFLPPKVLISLYERGVRSFHLVADYHGRGADGKFVMDLIRETHRAFVESGVRDEVTLIGCGGIVAAEHVPKAIICGLDAVALDTAPLAALQIGFHGECENAGAASFVIPAGLTEEWATQRLKNLFASWRDQLLEVLGAMGLREVRRLRGEWGRAMFQPDLEREAFGDIEGYPINK